MTVSSIHLEGSQTVTPRPVDTDGDGLIENGGFPDQTYDNWVARGEGLPQRTLPASLRAPREAANG
jgi:non-lysosomal glucosylceramidase